MKYLSKEEQLYQAVEMGMEMLKHDYSVRDLAVVFGRSKSTVHKYLTERIPEDNLIYPFVQQKLKDNFNNRGIISAHKRGKR